MIDLSKLSFKERIAYINNKIKKEKEEQDKLKADKLKRGEKITLQKKKNPFKVQPSLRFSRRFFVGRTPGDFSEIYEIVQKLGEGSYGQVFRVKKKTSGEIRACKQLSKSKLTELDSLNNEIEIMMKMDHPNIIKLYEVYEDPRYIYLVMEECLGGDLFTAITDHIDSGRMFTERGAYKIMVQIMSSINYIHSKKICHRDLKPENLLYLNKDDEILKLIDFGLSRYYKKDMKTKVGTVYYISPETLDGNYSEKCDIWSAGVILCILITGEPPFNGDNDNEILNKIYRYDYNLDGNEWKFVSSELKDLIGKMLCKECDRLTAAQVLEHPWFKKFENNEGEDVKLNINVNNLKKYVKMNKFKKVALNYIATRVDENDIKDLKKTFEEIDKNKDGELSLNELKEAIGKVKRIIPGEVEEIFKSMDSNKDGSISYSEFISAMITKQTYLKEKILYDTFHQLDVDNTGKISKDDILKVLQLEKKDEEKINQIIKEIDTNKDGEIDYNEFIDLMNKDEN